MPSFNLTIAFAIDVTSIYKTGTFMGSDCVAVGRAVASDIRGPMANLINIL